jgi:hypothetical protein
MPSCLAHVDRVVAEPVQVGGLLVAVAESTPAMTTGTTSPASSEARVSLVPSGSASHALTQCSLRAGEIGRR